MMQKLITPQGEKILKAERNRIRDEKMPKIIEAMAKARENRDYSENGELDAAKSERNCLNDRFVHIENYLNSVVKCIPTSSEVVDFGLKVKIANINDPSESREYLLVGERECSIEKGSICINAPFVRNMIGKKAGAIFTHINGREYKIVSIRIPSEEEILAAIDPK